MSADLGNGEFPTESGVAEGEPWLPVDSAVLRRGAPRRA
jgi:hypothetical protein